MLTADNSKSYHADNFTPATRKLQIGLLKVLFLEEEEFGLNDSILKLYKTHTSLRFFKNKVLMK